MGSTSLQATMMNSLRFLLPTLRDLEPIRACRRSRLGALLRPSAGDGAWDPHGAGRAGHGGGQALLPHLCLRRGRRASRMSESMLDSLLEVILNEWHRHALATGALWRLRTIGSRVARRNTHVTCR